MCVCVCVCVCVTTCERRRCVSGDEEAMSAKAAQTGAGVAQPDGVSVIILREVKLPFRRAYYNPDSDEFHNMQNRVCSDVSGHGRGRGWAWVKARAGQGGA